MTGVAKKTVIRLVVEVGAFCADYQDRVFRNLNCQRMQVDECWSFVYAKEKNVTADRTLRTTPAMAAGIADKLGEVADLVAAWEAEEQQQKAA